MACAAGLLRRTPQRHALRLVGSIAVAWGWSTTTRMRLEAMLTASELVITGFGAPETDGASIAGA